MDKRTRERLKQHTPHILLVVRESNAARCLDNQPAKMFECSCGWKGWLKAEFLPTLSIGDILKESLPA